MNETPYLWECPLMGCEYTRHMGPYETMGVWTPGCMIHQDTLLVPVETRLQRERAILLEEFRQVCREAIAEGDNRSRISDPEWMPRMKDLLDRTRS